MRIKMSRARCFWCSDCSRKECVQPNNWPLHIAPLAVAVSGPLDTLLFARFAACLC